MSETCRSKALRGNARRHPRGELALSFGALLLAILSTLVSLTPACARPPSVPRVTPPLAVARIEPAPPGRPVSLPDASPDVPASLLPSVEDRVRALGYDPTNMRDAIAAYRAGHIDAGDALADSIANPRMRTALEWVAIRNLPQGSGLDRLRAFVDAHPDWAAPRALRHKVEERLPLTSNPLSILQFFTTRAPETANGKLALAMALKQTGRVADGTRLARAVFREHDLSPYLENWIHTEFPGDLTRGDYRYRADRLLYKGYVGAGLRYAAQAGPQVLAVATARTRPSGQAIAALPESLRSDPGLILAEAHRLRRAKKLIEAAQLLQSVTDPQAQLVDADAWWTERRVLARELLDADKPKAAYITCALQAQASDEISAEAQFHAGWIALRFLHEPQRAAYHFWAAAKGARSPSSISRIAYWRGRTAEASVDLQVIVQAKAFYEQAANYSSTYYGQLARQSLGLPAQIVQAPTGAASGDERAEAIRIIELLYAAGEKESAEALAMEAAQTLQGDRQIAALSAVIADQQDAHLSWAVGTNIAQRGIPIDPLAFPAFGIPTYKEVANSASLPVVYSVARQESTFISRAVSGAHANGLMQMLDGTARETARRAGLSFSHARLLQDAAFNAQLGAAHLGILMAEHDGSLILTFAAYNAGGGQVRKWIDAYGDPRRPGVDPIDWVERIPFTETRNYVQRVMANVAVYSAIFAEKAKRDAIAKRDHEAHL